MPNFASRNQSGIIYLRKDVRIGSNGPASIDELCNGAFLSKAKTEDPNCREGMVSAIFFKRFLLDNGMRNVLVKNV